MKASFFRGLTMRPLLIFTVFWVLCVSVIGSLIFSVPEWRTRHPNLDSRLQRLLWTYEEKGLLKAQEFAQRTGLKPELVGTSVRVEIEAGSSADIEHLTRMRQAVERIGGRIEVIFEHLTQAIVPLSALLQLAELPEVRFIRAPILLQVTQGQVVSEGVRLINGNTWQQAGFSGRGVKVAIFDLGFKGYRQLLGTELPREVVVQSFRTDNDLEADEEHGTAIAEIIHDIAPRAQLLLMNGRTRTEWGRAVEWAIEQGVSVISSSVGRPPECHVGDSFAFGRVAKKARDRGILWVSSAGNEAENHWGGAWRDDDNDGIQNFTTTDETINIRVFKDEPIGLWLVWDDPCEHSGNDYDLYLLDDKGNILDVSDSIQNGDDFPVEIIAWTPEVDAIFHVQIRRKSGARPVNFDLFTEMAVIQLEHIVPAGSIDDPAISPSIMAVGAFHHADGKLLSYSSRGPTRDGRIKPDIAAPSHVSTVSYGRYRGGQNQGFTGTSASAPHVAGAAALIKQAFPNYAAEQIQKFLEDRAEDHGPPGKDNDWGAGQLVLGQPPTQPTRPAVPSSLSTSARSPTVIDLSWRDNSNDEDGFEIERQLQGRDWQRITTVDRNITNYTDTGLSPNTAYCYRVRAYNAAGSSDYSNTSCATTPSLNRAPIANAGPDQTVAVGATVQLDGSRSSDPDGDPLTFRWVFILRPAGSTTTLSNPNIVNPTFVADLPGEYLVELTVDDGKGGRSSARVRVTAISSPVIAVEPQRLEFVAIQGGHNPDAKMLQVTNAGGGTLNWSAVADVPWVNLSQDRGTAPSTVTVAVEISRLPVATHSGRITITAPGATNIPFIVAVILTIQPSQPPRIQVTPDRLTFQATLGGAPPAPQTLTIANTGGGILSWTALTDVPWIKLVPMSGAAPPEAKVSVSVEITGLGVGRQEGRIIVTASDAVNSPVIVPVTLQIVGIMPSLLALKFTQLRLTAGNWERTLRTGCVVYRSTSDVGKLQLLLASGGAQEFTTPGEQEVLVCNDLVHLESLGSPRLLDTLQVSATQLALKFIKLELGDPARWERGMRESCLIYRNIQAEPNPLKVVLADGTTQEFAIPAEREFFICSDVIHLESHTGG